MSDLTTARIVGVLFIVATGFAVAGNLLLGPIRDESDYLASFSTHENRVIMGVLTEVVLAVAVVGIAVLLFPILKRQDEGLALGYVGVRILEATIILIGGISSLLLLTVSQDFVGAGAPSDSEFGPLGALMLEVRDWTDALGPTLMFGITALILYPMLYRGELVPRWLSVWGFVGAVLLVVVGVMVLSGESPTSTVSILLTLPIAVNEMVLALWLIVKGFGASTLSSRDPAL